MPLDFLERLRAADEGRKRVSIAVGTAIAMAIVVAIWFTYFNPFEALRGPEEESQLAAIAESGGGNGFSFWESAKGIFRMIADLFGGTYEVRPGSN